MPDTPPKRISLLLLLSPFEWMIAWRYLRARRAEG